MIVSLVFVASGFPFEFALPFPFTSILSPVRSSLETVRAFSLFFRLLDFLCPALFGSTVMSGLTPDAQELLHSDEEILPRLQGQSCQTFANINIRVNSEDNGISLDSYWLFLLYSFT